MWPIIAIHYTAHEYSTTITPIVYVHSTSRLPMDSALSVMNFTNKVLVYSDKRCHL